MFNQWSIITIDNRTIQSTINRWTSIILRYFYEVLLKY